VIVTFDEAGVPRVNGIQGTIIVGDFDFDGREDFAVQAGASASYSGPLFAVFLQAKGERVVRSEVVSQLTQYSFFEVDAAEKRLRVEGQGGCCSFEVTEEYAVVDGAPHIVARVTEETSDDFVRATEEHLVAGRWQTTRRTTRRSMPSPP